MSKGTLPTKSRFFYSTTFNEYLQNNPNPLFLNLYPTTRPILLNLKTQI